MSEWPWPKIIAGAAIGTIAIVAGKISYTHISWLALAVGQTPGNSHLMPFAVDGLIVVGSVVLLTARSGQAWIGWLCIGAGAAATLFANIESGRGHGLLGAVVAGWPAIAFTLASFALERWLHGMAGRPRPTVAGCGHEPTGEPERDVQLAYLHTRDCLGETPSVRHLSATSGLSRYKVAELTGPLNGHKTLESVS